MGRPKHKKVPGKEKFIFSLDVEGAERTGEVLIDSSELCPKVFDHPSVDRHFLARYRKSVIDKHMMQWAQSKLKLRYEEV